MTDSHPKMPEEILKKLHHIAILLCTKKATPSDGLDMISIIFELQCCCADLVEKMKDKSK